MQQLHLQPRSLLTEALAHRQVGVDDVALVQQEDVTHWPGGAGAGSAHRAGRRSSAQLQQSAGAGSTQQRSQHTPSVRTVYVVCRHVHRCQPHVALVRLRADNTYAARHGSVITLTEALKTLSKCVTPALPNH